ncbi:MAG: Ig domain-containing protein [Dehalococcoidia bacterium]
MKKRLAALMGIFLIVAVTGSFWFRTYSYSVDYVRPDLYNGEASRNPVSFGAQPEPSPLILSARLGVGGSIDKISVDLAKLSGARYYDPGSDCMKSVSGNTPMWRVYEIDGEEAYLLETDDEYKDYKYRTAITHKVIEGSAAGTNKWQLELPNTGYSFGDHNLRVTVVNEFSHSSTIKIPLSVVYDWKAPRIMPTVNYFSGGHAACAGERVTIEAKVNDDLSGTFAVRLSENEAGALFGERPKLTMGRQINTSNWSVENVIPAGVAPGTYDVHVTAVDLAGNKSSETVSIKVVEEKPSFQIKLDEGWNLISVPKALKNPSIRDVFGGTPVVSVQTLIEGRRLEPAEIEPGRGYLVKSLEKKTVEVDFASHDPSAIPLMLDLKPGWNLIGYVSQNLEPVMPLTFYLGADMKGKWMIVYTEEGSQARPKSTSPYVWATDSFPTITGKPYSEDDDNLPAVELGKGYWIYLTGEAVLIP